MNLTRYKRWLAFGTGVGIEIGRTDLTVAVVRVRPSGVEVLGDLAIHGYREHPASEWGATYGKFLRKLGAGHVAASVLLPREEVIVRQVALPGVADKDVPAALRYQIDSLHPFSEDEAIYDWARTGRTGSILVGIVRRPVVEYYAALFAEAGIKVSGFTFSAAVFYSALRLLGQPPADGFLVVSQEADGVELYGESAARPVFSARVAGQPARARDMAVAELRLPPETRPVAMQEVLPAPKAAPPEYDAAQKARPFATALAGACPALALKLNLLPEDKRRASSHLVLVPTAVLAALVLILLGALAGYSSIENRRYLQVLDQEIRKLEPQARQAPALDRAIETARNKSQVLDTFRSRTKADMDAVQELTKILPPPTWVSGLEMTRNSVTISGETEQAASLLKVLDKSPFFEGSEFTMPMAKIGNLENFRIRANREGSPQ